MEAGGLCAIVINDFQGKCFLFFRKGRIFISLITSTNQYGSESGSYHQGKNIITLFIDNNYWTVFKL